MARFAIDLPLPMPANNAYPTNPKTGRRYLCKRAREWKTEAGWIINAARPPKIAGPYTFRILIPEAIRGDADGRIKLAQDLMVELGVTPDDHKAVDSRATRDARIPLGMCRIIIESVA